MCRVCPEYNPTHLCDGSLNPPHFLKDILHTLNILHVVSVPDVEKANVQLIIKFNGKSNHEIIAMKCWTPIFKWSHPVCSLSQVGRLKRLTV